MKNPYIEKLMSEACEDYYLRFQQAFKGVESGAEICSPTEIYDRLDAFFGGFPFDVDCDNIWWSRGMKAMHVKSVHVESQEVYYLGGLECKISRMIPFDCPSGHEKAFVYLDCASMPSLREDCDKLSRIKPLWNVEPLSFYKGQLIEEYEAEEGRVQSPEGDYIDIARGELIRFGRFVSPQNLLLVAKACPIIRYESAEAWKKMDEILSGTGTVEELREMIQARDCQPRHNI